MVWVSLSSPTFQFPSNGKVFLNIWREWGKTQAHPSVSIPFKREGLSERFLLFLMADTTYHNRFQFPSNGKVFLNLKGLIVRKDNSPTVSIPFKREGLSEQGFWFVLFIGIVFQFPSNGKVFLNSHIYESDQLTVSFRFNSLQTGRSF